MNAVFDGGEIVVRLTPDHPKYLGLARVLHARRNGDAVTLSRDALGHEHASDGKFATTGGTKADKPKGSKPQSIEDIHAQADEIAEKHAKSGVLSKLGAAGKWMKDKTKAVYGKLEERYGRKTAIAIFAAGHVAGLATPLVVVPGSTLIGMAPFAAMAEVYLQARKGLKAIGLSQEGELSADKIMELGKKLVEDLSKEWEERQVAALSMSSNEKGRWITIGAKAGKDGKKNGGTPVYIENGKITKGAPSLTGKKISALNQQEEYKELTGSKRSQASQKAAKTKEENRREEGYQRAVWGKKAKKEGIEPKHLHQLAAELLAHDKEFKAERQSMLNRAKSALDEHGGKHRKIASSQARGGKSEIEDHTQIAGIDEVAEQMASQFPHLFHPETGAHGGHDDQLFAMLQDGGDSPMSEDDAYSQAFDHLHEMKSEGAYQGSDEGEEAIPFSMEDETDEPDTDPFHALASLYADLWNATGQTPDDAELETVGGELADGGWVLYHDGDEWKVREAERDEDGSVELSQAREMFSLSKNQSVCSEFAAAMHAVGISETEANAAMIEARDFLVSYSGGKWTPSV